MRTDKFWKLINENPWVYALITGGMEREEIKGRVENPFMLAIYLARTIPESYEWIAVRPFSRRILSQTTDLEASEHVTKIAAVFLDHDWTVCWHKTGEEKFSRSDDVYRMTVGECIEAIRRQNEGCVIDAVVRCRITHGSKRLSRGSARMDTESLIREAYDIYLIGGK